MTHKIPATVFLIWIVLWILTACGIKAPPVALESTQPGPVADLQALSREGGVYLIWTLPTENTDRSRLEDLLGFKVYRQKRPLASSACPDCPLRWQEMAEIDLAYPRRARVEAGKVLWPDDTVQPQNEYLYMIRGYNSYKSFSPESDRVRIFWDTPPAAPSGIKIENQGIALEIRWEFSFRLLDGREITDFAGFNLYRREAGGEFGLFPLNPDPVRAKQYRDRPLPEGKRYDYQVRAVRLFRSTPIEGPGSAPAGAVVENVLSPWPIPIARYQIDYSGQRANHSPLTTDN